MSLSVCYSQPQTNTCTFIHRLSGYNIYLHPTGSANATAAGLQKCVTGPEMDLSVKLN